MNLGLRQVGILLTLMAVPILEMALLFKTGQAIGVWPTVLMVVVSSICGTYVFHSQGFYVMARVTEAMSRGVVPIAPVVDGFFLLIAGLLLIVPGLITSGLGLLLLVPQIRRPVAVLAVRNLIRSSRFHAEFKSWYGQGGRPSENRPGPAPGWQSGEAEGPIIEGEFRRVDEPPPRVGGGSTNRPERR